MISVLSHLPRQEWVSREQFSQDATQGPDVDGHPVLGPEDHLRGPVEATLNVSVDPLVLQTR